MASGPIVPRWEWRTFGEEFEGAEAQLAATPLDQVQDSDEVYLLSVLSQASVKIRDDLLDVKTLEQVDGEGLEQWRPVLKLPFPLTASGVGEVLATLGVPAPLLERSDYTLSEFLDEVVRPNGDLLAIEVHKRREHYTFAGCMAEVTELRTEQGAIRSIAIESVDPGLVIAAVRTLGLAGRRNVSVPRGLATLADFGTRRYAVIDVGTNSVKFRVADLGLDGEWKTVVDRSELTQLGEGLQDTGQLNPEPSERTIDAIAGMVDEAKQDNALAIAAVGTAGLRMATNGEAFVSAVQARSGIEVEIISGEEESRLAFLAAESGLAFGTGSVVVFDTGGGSSQFTFGNGTQVTERFSLNVGAVRFTERYALDGAVSEEALAAALAAIAADLSQLDGRPTPDAFIAMGGAVTNLAAIKHELSSYDPTIVQGTVLERAEIERQIELFRTRSAEERRAIVGLQPKRAEVILAGACIVLTALTKLGSPSLTVSDRGLRHGVMIERFG
jgi:exopolyphosphatase/guanosine-5'-triphosphate,3'-diphosphate pyrophosphatase